MGIGQEGIGDRYQLAESKAIFENPNKAILKFDLQVAWLLMDIGGR
jgi:hypothetical protein